MMLSVIISWVVKTSVMASILAVLILLVRTIFKGKLGARWQYAIWMLLIVRLLMPLGIQSPFSIYNFVCPELTVIEGSEVQNPGSGISRANVYISDNTDYIANGAGPSGNNPGLQEQNNNAQAKVQVTRNSSDKWRALPSILWAAGVSALVLFIIIESIMFYLKLKDEAPTDDEKILQILNKCRGKLGITRTIPVIISNMIKSPCLYGAFRPRIILPQGIMHKISEEDMEYIFLHELSHYKRRDIPVNWIAAACQVMHWFNPIVWFCFHKMREDCELACDAYALSHLDEDEHERYGMSIINLLAVSRPMWAPITTGLLGNSSRKQIFRRIREIKMFKKKKWVWTIAAILVIVCLAVIGLSNANHSDPDGTSSKAGGEAAGDSIGGVVQYDSKKPVATIGFSELINNSHMIANDLGISFMTLKLCPGVMNGRGKYIIAVHLTLFNYSGSPMYIYPDRAYMVNEDGEKATASGINSVGLGGEIEPNQFKEGDILFPLSEDVFKGYSSFQLVIDGPVDKDGSKLGDDVVLDINFNIELIPDGIDFFSEEPAPSRFIDFNQIRSLTRQYGYDSWVLLSATYGASEVLLYHKSMQSDGDLDSKILSLDSEQKVKGERDVSLSPELKGYELHFIYGDSSQKKHLLPYRLRRDDAVEKNYSDLLVMEKNDLGKITILQSYVQNYKSQSLIPTVIEFTVDTIGDYVVYQDVDLIWKVQDIKTRQIYSSGENTAELSKIQQYYRESGEYIYLLKYTEDNSVLAFDTETKKFTIIGRPAEADGDKAKKGLTLDEIKESYEKAGEKIISIKEYENYVIVESQPLNESTHFTLYNLKTGDKDVLLFSEEHVDSQRTKMIDQNHFVFYAKGTYSLSGYQTFPYEIHCTRGSENTGSDSDFTWTNKDIRLPVDEQIFLRGKMHVKQEIIDVRATANGLQICFGPQDSNDVLYSAAYFDCPGTDISYDKDNREFILKFKDTRLSELYKGTGTRSYSNSYIKSLELKESGSSAIITIKLNEGAKYYLGKKDTIAKDDWGIPYMEIQFFKSDMF